MLRGSGREDVGDPPPQRAGTDGDHGRGVARDERAACHAVAEQHLGTGDASRVAGTTWADQGDRSSEVLWGRDKALRAGIDAVTGSKGARRGNRAANSLVPFVAVFEGGTATNPPPPRRTSR